MTSCSSIKNQESLIIIPTNELNWIPKNCNIENIVVSIENVVCTCNVGFEFNLHDLVKKLYKYGTKFNPAKFPASIIRFRYDNSKIAFLIFKNGKIVCCGSKNEYQARISLSKLLKFLLENGYPTFDIYFNIQNMVCCCKLPWNINLQQLSEQYSQFCVYQPEKFPGVIINYTDIKPIVVLIFELGSMVITGATNEDEIKECLKIIPNLFKDFFLETEKIKIEIKGQHLLTSTKNKLIESTFFKN